MPALYPADVLIEILKSALLRAVDDTFLSGLSLQSNAVTQLGMLLKPCLPQFCFVAVRNDRLSNGGHVI